MPTLHRLACFRDDVVFLIFLYQRWIYRIDPKRVNEVRGVAIYNARMLNKTNCTCSSGKSWSKMMQVKIRKRLCRRRKTSEQSLRVHVPRKDGRKYLLLQCVEIL
jgi:hypothetical protein